MFGEESIVFEDKSLIVVNKPSGLLTVSTPKGERNTLINRTTEIIRKRNISHIVVFACHRLDRETSGLIILAKSQNSQRAIMDQFRAGKVKKRYLAFIDGVPMKMSGVLKFPIDGKTAITRYRLIERRRGFSVIEATPETGRTNQLRIHFKMLGHPLLGERKFAFGKDFKIKFRRVALHACAIKFKHPESNEVLNFTCELPDDMSRLVGGSIKAGDFSFY